MRSGRLVLGSCLLVAGVAGCGRFGFEDQPDDMPDGTMLTIRISGPGTGTITGTDGIVCTSATGTCVIDVTGVSSVTLRGVAATGSWFSGWSGPCGGNFDCAIPITGDVTVDAELMPTPNRVFVSAAEYRGDFGSVAAADAECELGANTANLQGTFIAYLGSTTLNPIERLAGSRGWIRTDGAPVADLPDAFANGPLMFPNRLDEHGTDLLAVPVFTGTRQGLGSVNTCTDWTSFDPAISGDAVRSDWGTHSATGYATDGCDGYHHLMCIEVGRNVPVASKPDTGRLAFLTTNGWTPGAGRDDADALCATEASAAAFPGTYLAAVATTTDTISARFDPTGLPWRRTDGIRLVHLGSLFTTDFLDVAPERGVGGGVMNVDFWTGSRRFNQLPTGSDNCLDWSVGDATQMGQMGYSSVTNVTDSAKFDACNSAVSLLCLQQ